MELTDEWVCGAMHTIRVNVLLFLYFGYFLCMSDSEIAFVYSSVTNHCLLSLPVFVFFFFFAMSMNSFSAVI